MGATFRGRMSKNKPFQHFKDLNQKTYNFSDDYTPSLMNLCFSTYMDTARLASELEYNKTVGKLHYDTLFHATTKCSRKWRPIPRYKNKRNIEEETLITSVALYYRMDETEAKNIIKYLEDADISVIMEHYNKYYA